MEKKIFVKKGQKAGGVRSYLKLLMWSAGALIILVLLIPLGTRKKSEVDSTAKQAPEKGVLFREIPKTPPSALEEEKKADGIPGFVPFDKSPDAVDASRGKSPVETQAAGKVPSGQEKISDAGHGTVGPQATADVAQKGALEKGSAPGDAQPPPTREGKTAMLKEGAPASDKPEDPARKTVQEGVPPKEKAATEPKGKTAAQKLSKPAETGVLASASPGAADTGDGKRLMYVVQVGSFKEKSNAEEMQRNLEKKGYAVQVRSRTDPKLGPLFVVQLAPVPDLSKASTLVEQIRREDKVKPFVVKVGGGE